MIHILLRKMQNCNKDKNSMRSKKDKINKQSNYKKQFIKKICQLIHKNQCSQYKFQ
jgi:hypothetical protein